MRLALTLPGWPGRIQNNPVNNPNLIDPNTVGGSGQPIVTIGSVFSELSSVALYVGAFLMFFWMAWGVFDYIRAEGNKEALAKARKRIQWAIAGFIILLASFFMSDLVRDVLLSPGGIITRQTQPIQVISPP